jgi:hypothetical protein
VICNDVVVAIVSIEDAESYGLDELLILALRKLNHINCSDAQHFINSASSCAVAPRCPGRRLIISFDFIMMFLLSV